MAALVLRGLAGENIVGDTQALPVGIGDGRGDGASAAIGRDTAKTSKAALQARA